MLGNVLRRFCVGLHLKPFSSPFVFLLNVITFLSIIFQTVFQAMVIILGLFQYLAVSGRSIDKQVAGTARETDKRQNILFLRLLHRKEDKTQFEIPAARENSSALF